jgi:hypothetical protein
MVLLQFVKVGRAQVQIGLLPRQQVVSNDQDGMAQGNERMFLAPSGSDALALGRQVGLLGFGSHMCGFHQHLSQPSPDSVG